MVNQKTERFLRIAFVFYPVNGVVSDKVRDISMFLDSVIVLCDEIRIVVVALSGDNLPVIKTGRQTFKMPFTYQCCLITDFLQQLRKSLLRTVEYASGIIKNLLAQLCLPVIMQARLGPLNELATKL